MSDAIHRSMEIMVARIAQLEAGLLAAEKRLTEFQDMAIHNGQQALLLGERVRELENVLRDASDLLDTDTEATIGHGSALHRAFRAHLQEPSL